MATILLIGSDQTLLEGLAQSLVNAGHTTFHAHTAAQGVEIALADRPLVVVVERRSAETDPDALRIPLASGGAVLLCHRDGDASSALPPVLQRHVLADLTLPLERNRLHALIYRVADRARVTGRETGAAPDLRPSAGAEPPPQASR
jgi:DNA-binding NtrC family response regulator